MRRTFFCGPLEVVVTADDRALHDKIVETLDLYNIAWAPPLDRVHIDATGAAPAVMVFGTLLVCARMHVDGTPAGLYATCRSGAACTFSEREARWSISVPRDDGVPEDVEDLVGLALTTSWRRLGWVPIHAGAVAKEGRCAILCAPSGGGKSTMTAALIRRRWRALGDDKLLLRLDDARQPELAALLHTFNLHPCTRQWFPELGDLEVLPRYSAWTEKRKVRVEDIWPGSTLRCGRPTHLVQLDRVEDLVGIRVSRLNDDEVLDLLLRQTVIPHDRRTATQVLATVVPTARRLSGIRVAVGENAYRDNDCLAALEDALQ